MDVMLLDLFPPQNPSYLAHMGSALHTLNSHLPAVSRLCKKVAGCLEGGIMDKRYDVGDLVEIAGDPSDEGMKGSWWYGKVIEVIVTPRGRKYKVEYRDILQDDGLSNEAEVLSITRIRPLAPDDSDTMPLSEHVPGDAVDCTDKDGWWQGYVQDVWDDRISIYFPMSQELYENIQIPDKEGRKVRSSYSWDPITHSFQKRKRKFFGGENFRTAPAVEEDETKSKEEAKPPVKSPQTTAETTPIDKKNKPVAVKRGISVVDDKKKKEIKPAAKLPAKKEREVFGKDSSQGKKPAAAAKVTAAAAAATKTSAPPSKKHTAKEVPPKKAPSPAPCTSPSGSELSTSSSDVPPTAHQRAREGVKLMVGALIDSSSEDEEASRAKGPTLSPMSKKLTQPPLARGPTGRFASKRKLVEEEEDVKGAKKRAIQSRPPQLPEKKAPFIIPKRQVSLPEHVVGQQDKKKKKSSLQRIEGGSGTASLQRSMSIKRSTLWCLDNIGSWVTSSDLQVALSKHLCGLKRVHVASVPLDIGSSHAGYAVVEFITTADADAQEGILKELCIKDPGMAVPRPLVARRPRVTKTYHWGDGGYPGHLNIHSSCNAHFAQPNSLEFDMALEWRVAEEVAARAREALHVRQAGELVSVLQEYIKEKGEKVSRIRTGSLQPPRTPPSPRSSCLWLRNIPPKDRHDEERLKQTITQFGFPQKIVMLRDPVTNLRSGHAIVWMETPERAEIVAQNLHQMVFILDGTPRPVHAEVARAGPPRGSQSVFDRAVRAVLGKKDAGNDNASGTAPIELVRVPDSAAVDAAATAEMRAAAKLRECLAKHVAEQDAARNEAIAESHRLSDAHHRRYAVEKEKLERLQKLQESEFFMELCRIYSIPFKRYGHKGAVEITMPRHNQTS